MPKKINPAISEYYRKLAKKAVAKRHKKILEKAQQRQKVENQKQ
jgi:hypothetical protein